MSRRRDVRTRTPAGHDRRRVRRSRQRRPRPSGRPLTRTFGRSVGRPTVGGRENDVGTTRKRCRRLSVRQLFVGRRTLVGCDGFCAKKKAITQTSSACAGTGEQITLERLGRPDPTTGSVEVTAAGRPAVVQNAIFRTKSQSLRSQSTFSSSDFWRMITTIKTWWLAFQTFS